ncbi:hypothetical protein [Corynebacterium halotolerans]|uniref:Nitroreductase domain-containing protein n=1 Tax=Corynebacterium halotolerans YIM 70093 = DSM 44683 TaxID=1121362 RepID=M1P8W1_9CORY|nr:hypothetical protein [Corynebacterium halotolerans]AGF73106.1 hypothetical protein A605_10530 [Corynebacterium halotolerans YIM 70093 = DSM 44683]
MTPLHEIIDTAVTTAARAPSVHNTQPWEPGTPVIDGDEAWLEVGVDPSRTLPAADPSHMDLLLGLGCWIESFAIAAAAQGARADVVAVTGTAPDITVALRVRREAGIDEIFTATDIRHRQVDRGRLEPDPAALQAALGDAEAEWPARRATHGYPEVVVGMVPESMWSRLAPIAGRHLAGSPALIRETIAWLRLDPAHPRHGLDGLSAETLRIPPRRARLAARLLRSRPAGMLIDHAGFWHRALHRVHRMSARASAGVPRRKRPPARLVLGARPGPVTPGEWIGLGRVLMRLWLTLDRYGLRVSVHSELKNPPDTARFLRRLVDGEPFAVFSVGRSVPEEVPRSARRF